MGGAAPGRFYFNTDALPERDRFGTYCEELVRRWNGLDAHSADEAHFYAELQLRLCGEIGVGHSANSRIDFSRTRDLMRDGDDTLYAVLLTSGRACAMQGEGEHPLASGDGIVCDNGYTGGFSYTDESRSWCIRIPRRQLARRLPGSFRFAGAKLDRNPTAHRLLLGYVGTAFDIDFSGDESTRAVHEAHIVDLVALALGVEGDERAIDRHSADPALTAVTVAASLGITPRYVHLLLEETGRSFSDHLLEKRLARAAAALGDPARADQRITDVAADAGFGDLSYFGRTFRRRYGMTPSDMREAARRVRRWGE